IPEEVLAGIRQATGLGTWMMRFAVYGRDAQVEESLTAIHAALDHLPGVTVTTQTFDGHDLPTARMDQSQKVQAGVTDMSMLSILKYVGENGGHVGFASVVPSIGQDVAQVAEMMKQGSIEFDTDYSAGFIFNGRAAVHVWLAIYDRDDEVHARKAYEVC